MSLATPLSADKRKTNETGQKLTTVDLFSSYNLRTYQVGRLLADLSTVSTSAHAYAHARKHFTRRAHAHR